MRLCWTHPSGHLHKITLSVGRFVSCGGQVGPLGNEEIADMSLGFQSSKDGMEGKIKYSHRKPLDVIFGLWGSQMLLDMKSEGLR